MTRLVTGHQLNFQKESGLSMANGQTETQRQSFLSKLKMIYYRQFVIRFKILKGTIRSKSLYAKTLKAGRCYYGPFTGEFGHLLGHNLPFIAYLYSKGVQVEFCGMEIHRPFFVDEKGQEIVSSYLPLRDFFKEAAPDCNSATEPEDVHKVSNRFVEKAKTSGLPYWDLSDRFHYFESFRWWIARQEYEKAFDLSKTYKTRDEDSVVIFPRKRNTNFSQEAELRNNGEAWDYYEVAKIASRYFEKVYVVGHPAFSVGFESFNNVEVSIANDNAYILEKCSNSRLIICQHSGSVYLGEYTNTQVLIIYKGGRKIGDIEITRQFKNALGRKFEFDYAYSLEEIDSYLSKKYETVRN